jgi:hypothetical protein
VNARGSIGLALCLSASACRYWPEDDTAAPSGEAGTLRIAELVARNDTAARDPEGRWSDWVELVNPTEVDLPLDGWAVTDDLEGGERHPLDGLVLRGGDRLTLWLAGEPSFDPSILDFALDADGEAFGVYDPRGVLVDGVRFGALPEDVALVRAGDGAGGWTVAWPATPGMAPAGDAGVPEGVPDPDGVPGPGPRCDLATDLVTTTFLEGEPIEFSVSCTGELALGDALFAPAGLPTGAEWDPAAGRLSWTTDAAAAGRQRFVFATWPADGSAAVPQVEVVSVDVVNDLDQPDAGGVNPASYREEWGVPVIHVAMTGTPTTGFEVPAVVTWAGRPYDATVEVHGRTSTRYPKVSYELNFDVERLPVDRWEDTVQHLLLITPFDDNSYVRQRLAYDLWRATGDALGAPRYGPDPFFVVVYFDGVYHGLYHAIQKLDHDAFARQGLDPDLNVYKATDTDANYASVGSDGLPKDTWHDGFEKVDGDPEDDFSDLDAFVAFAASVPAGELAAQADTYAHWDEFQDWLLFVRFIAGEDSTSKNHLVVREPEGRFHYVPWDFNASFGQNWRTYRIGADFDDDFTTDNHLFAQIQSQLPLRSAQLERYRTLRDGPFSAEWLLARVDSYYAEIDEAARRDWAVWGPQYLAYEGWADERNEDADWTDLDGERAYLEAWIRARGDLFEEVLAEEVEGGEHEAAPGP